MSAYSYKDITTDELTFTNPERLGNCYICNLYNDDDLVYVQTPILEISNINLSVKVPFVNNRYDIDIYSDEYSLINIENICNFTKMKCDIYIDKIWKWNDLFTCKWKIKVIHLV